MNADLEAMAKRLELEKANLESLLELIKKQHQEEISIMEQAAKWVVDTFRVCKFNGHKLSYAYY